MSKKTRTRRRKLTAHDRGNDRHNKGVAHERKQARRAAEHQIARSTRRVTT